MISDEDFMRLALDQAACGERIAEVPVGAIVVKDSQVIGIGHNRSIVDSDPCGHAEIIALRHAAKFLGNYRLDECTLYVTLEPCPMCMGAVVHSRIKRLVYGAKDPKTGAAGSFIDLAGNSKLNHHCSVTGGVLAQECSNVLSRYFQKLRDENRSERSLLRQDALRLEEGVLRRLLTPFTESVQSKFSANLAHAQQLRIHYLATTNVDESQSVIVFIHGATTWSYVYRHALSLSQQVGFSAVALDLPGHGWSDKTKRGLIESDVGYQLAILQEFIDLFGNKSIHVVAMDMACVLAMRLKQFAASKIHSITLINPCLRADYHYPDDPSLQRRFPASIKQFSRLLIHQTNHRVDVVDALLAPYPDNGHFAALVAAATKEVSQKDELLDCNANANAKNRVIPKKIGIHSWRPYQSRSIQFCRAFLIEEAVQYLHDADCELLSEAIPGYWDSIVRGISEHE